MTRRTVCGVAFGLFLALALALTSTTVVAETLEGKTGTSNSEQTDTRVQKELDRNLAERRKAMMQEASDAFEETNTALTALDAGDSQQALDALARATGKLELLVVRDPAMALAPVDVNFVTHDLYATPEAVRKARNEAEELLEDGKVQAARGLLSVLASEVVISVTNLPLATYPDAIKAITPLIDEGKTEEAKAALQAALNTMVVTKHVVSLPVVRAKATLKKAEALIGAEEISEEDKKEVNELVKNAREHVEVAELLGYGAKEDYKQYRRTIAELEDRIRDEGDTRNVFTKLQKSLDKFKTSFIE